MTHLHEEIRRKYLKTIWATDPNDREPAPTERETIVRPLLAGDGTGDETADNSAVFWGFLKNHLSFTKSFPTARVGAPTRVVGYGLMNLSPRVLSRYSHLEDVDTFASYWESRVAGGTVSKTLAVVLYLS